MINPESQNRTGPSGRACDLLPATVLAFLLALAGLSAFPSPARAQADEPDGPAVKDTKSARSTASEAPARRYGREFADIALADAVDTRPRADYDPNGIIGGDLLYGTLRSVDRRTGARRGDSLSDSLTLLPTLGSKLGYTDNVLRRQSDRRSDELLEETPALKLRSEWDNHEFTADIGGAFGRYARNSSQNYDDLHAQVAGRIDVSDFQTLSLQLGYSRLHEVPNGFNSPGTSMNPIVNSDTGGSGSWSYQRDAVLAIVNGSARHMEFEDTSAADPVARNQHQRNHWEYDSTVRLGYEFAEGTLAYIEPGIGTRVYDRTPDTSGLNRDSTGYQFYTGFIYNTTAVTALDMAVGYLYRRYKDAQLESVSGPAARLQLIWNPTAFVTLTGNVARSIEETIQVGTSGEVQTVVGAKVDYEFMEQNILGASAQLMDLTGQSSGAVQARHDQVYSYGVNARRLLNENMSVRLGWLNDRQNSNEALASYTVNLWYISFNIGL